MCDDYKDSSGGIAGSGEEPDQILVANRRAAVIIGVGTSAGLPELSSAGPTARRIGAWLGEAKPGYDVTVITDENGREVTRSEIFKAIRKYVTVQVRYELLLVHFIGHGLYQARNDIWMLSDLQTDRAACVSLTATLNDAKFSGIPNVVVISDACRTLPGDAGLSDLDPSSVIPQYDEIQQETTCVDYFQATGRGAPAFEGEIDGERQSFLSYAFREAYRSPDRDMVLELSTPDGEPMFVVPNRKLGRFLKEVVDKKLGENDPAKSQRVFPVSASEDNVFIAQVDRWPPANTDTTARSRKKRRTRRFLPLNTKGSLRLPETREKSQQNTEIDRLVFEAKDKNAFSWNDPRLRYTPNSSHASESVLGLETQTGLILTGAGITRAAMIKGRGNVATDIPPPERFTNGISALPLEPGAETRNELALELHDGRCLFLPVMHGYICHVAVNDIGAHTIAFSPSLANYRSNLPQRRLLEIDRLRSLATKAMDENRFHVGSTAEAEKLANAIRMAKAVDPILGLLAAQAYAEAGMSERVRDVSMYMKNDIQADLFDVRLLSSRFWEEDPEHPTLPRCPMLTQNWALLGARRAKLPPALDRLRPFLSESLWTTFTKGAADMIFDAIRKGDL